MSGPNDRALRERAAKVIPGGMYGHQSVAALTANAPQFFSRAEGAYLWDVDGKKYLDFMCGYGPSLFGYAHPEINEAYQKQLGAIDAATGPASVIVELAEEFCSLIGHADWSIFCKNGTDATSMAVMAARAYRQKRKILVAKWAYHGSANWSTPKPDGTLAEDRAHIIHYQYNDAESLARAAEEAGDDLAGIIASPFKHDTFRNQEMPSMAFARAARDICDEKDALLIVDEVRAGLRLARECSWKSLGIEPDLTTWGKAIANGHPISCLLGSEKARDAAGSLYVTGSYWFAAAAMAASLATLKLVRETSYLEHTIAMGNRLRTGLEEVASMHSMNISQTGPSQLPLIMFNADDGKRDMDLGHAFADGMLKRGIYIHPYHNMFMSAALTAADIDLAIEMAEETAREIKGA